MATTKDLAPKTSTLAEDVDKELTCAICLSRYETPKVLPCLHTYCKGCLGDLLGKSREADRVTCPQCKEEHQLPEDGVDGFRTYFTINNLLELLQVDITPGEGGSLAQFTPCHADTRGNVRSLFNLKVELKASLVPRPCAFVACSTKFANEARVGHIKLFYGHFTSSVEWVG